MVCNVYCSALHSKVDDLQFAVEETSIDKGDLQVMSQLCLCVYFKHIKTFLLNIYSRFLSYGKKSTAGLGQAGPN